MTFWPISFVYATQPILKMSFILAQLSLSFTKARFLSGMYLSCLSGLADVKWMYFNQYFIIQVKYRYFLSKMFITLNNRIFSYFFILKNIKPMPKCESALQVAVLQLPYTVNCNNFFVDFF